VRNACGMATPLFFESHARAKLGGERRCPDGVVSLCLDLRSFACRDRLGPGLFSE